MNIPESSRQNRASVFKTLRWAVVLATVILLAVVVIGRWDTLSKTEFSLNAPWIVPASVVALVATLLLALAWRQLLEAYDCSVGVARAVRSWALSQTTRYLPSGLVPVAARASLATSDGVPAAVGAMSVVVEIATLLGWAAVASAIWAPGDWIHPALRVALGAAAVVGLLTLPFTLAGVRLGGSNRLSKRIAAAIGKVLSWLRVSSEALEALTGGMLHASRTGVWKAAGTYGLSVAARLAAFGFLAAAVLPLESSSDVWLVVGAAAASLVVGMIGITPAGLGVRETVLATLLTAHFGLGDALAYAVVLRAWEIAVELVFLAAATYLGRSPNKG